MNSSRQIEPHKITKPIQLLAAWLLGLVLVNGTFLMAAEKIHEPNWLTTALVIASISNVPLFLLAIFLLQTRFRPEMQEDSFYSKYLESKTGYTKREVTAESVENIREGVAKLEKIVSQGLLHREEPLPTQSQWAGNTIAVNMQLPNFAKIVTALSHANIPVHETFGQGASLPTPFALALGNHFTKEQINNLITTVLSVCDGLICYAGDEIEVNQYDRKVLIGCYGVSSGIEMSKLKSLMETQDIITEIEIYKIIGK